MYFNYSFRYALRLGSKSDGASDDGREGGREAHPDRFTFLFVLGAESDQKEKTFSRFQRLVDRGEFGSEKSIHGSGVREGDIPVSRSDEGD